MPRFTNIDGSGPSPGGAIFRWAVIDRITGRRRRSPGRAEVPQVRADVKLLVRHGAIRRHEHGTNLEQTHIAMHLGEVVLGTASERVENRPA